MKPEKAKIEERLEFLKPGKTSMLLTSILLASSLVLFDGLPFDAVYKVDGFCPSTFNSSQAADCVESTWEIKPVNLGLDTLASYLASIASIKIYMRY